MFGHARGPGLENSLTPLANGMFWLQRKESGVPGSSGVGRRTMVSAPPPPQTGRELQTVPLREGAPGSQALKS